MATWSAIGGGFSNPGTTDGEKVYTVKSAGSPYNVSVYDPADGSLTALKTWTTAEGVISFRPFLIYFKSALFVTYVIDETSPTPDRVIIERYDIAAGSWSVVLDEVFAEAASAYTTRDLVVSGNEIILYLPRADFPGYEVAIRYSTDGVTWQAGTIDTDPGPEKTLTGATLTWHQTRDTVHGPYSQLNYDGTGERIIRWTGSGFADHAAATGTYSFGDSTFHWRLNTNRQYSTDLSTWNTPADTDVIPLREINMPYPAGYKIVDNGGVDDAHLYFWDPETSAWGDSEFVIGAAVTSITLQQCIRLNSGNVYVRWTRDGAEGWSIRSEPIAMNFPDDTNFGDGLAEIRGLGMDADNEKLYVTVNQNGDLRLFTYDLETLTHETTTSFGAATYADLDSRAKGVSPVVRPGTDGVLLLRGRDGSDVQVQKSDNSGATFTDVSDGTWADSKYCVALLPDPLNPDDLVAAFGDDDLYRSTAVEGAWTKLGDAPATLREAARHPIDRADLLLAAQAADTLQFTNNFGVTFEDVSDTVGTINVIEVSRTDE